MATLIGGLALFVAGFIIAAEMRSAVASPAAATTGGGCYTNWNVDTCAAGYTAVETGQWTAIGWWSTQGNQTWVPLEFICASPKLFDVSMSPQFFSDTRSGSGDSHDIMSEPCATCCASGGATVGGIGELPNVAGTGGALPRNGIIIAAVTAMIAFGAGGWYARRRWGR